jgi:hypothetical protein
MSKVKLIVDSYGSLPGMGRVIDINLKLDEKEKVAGVIRTDFDTDEHGSTRVSDDINPVVPYEYINTLVGRLLTLIDASTVDKEQRQAQKDLFKQIAWDWYQSYGDNLTPPWRKDKEANTKSSK